MTATTPGPGDLNRLRGRAYQRALTALKTLHPLDYELWLTLAKIKQEPVDQYSGCRILREKYRSEFDELREQIYQDLYADTYGPPKPPPTEEEHEAALVSIREAMTELSQPKPVLCAHDGGIGIGAGHTCSCVREVGHPLDGPRPHGCSCGALWGERVSNVEIRNAKSVHDVLLAHLEELGVEMPSAAATAKALGVALPDRSDPDVRLFVKDQVMVAAVLAHHLGTTVEECLDIGVAC